MDYGHYFVTMLWLYSNLDSFLEAKKIMIKVKYAADSIKFDGRFAR